MALGDIGAAIIDFLNILDPPVATITGDIAHATGDWFVVCHQDTGDAGTFDEIFLESFSCDTAGSIGAAVQSTIIVETGSGSAVSMNPRLIKIADGTIAVAYRNNSASIGVTVKTYSVDSSGNITGPDDTLALGGAISVLGSSITLNATKHANIFACLFFDSTNTNYDIHTFTISDAGAFTTGSTATIEASVSPNVAGFALVWTGQGDYHAACYGGSGNDGFVETFTISSDGLTIGATAHTFEFDIAEGIHTSIRSDSDGILIILSEGPSNLANVTTITVDGSGIMTAADDITAMTNTNDSTALIRIQETGAKNIFLGLSNSVLESWSFNGSGTLSDIDNLTVARANIAGRITIHPDADIVVGCGHQVSGPIFSVWSVSVDVEPPATPGSGLVGCTTFTITSTSVGVLVGGSITDATTEQDIRDGGKAIRLDLSGDTWVAAGATFDAERQNIIDGIDSAQSEGTGWDAVVMAGLAVTDVIRVTDTIVIIGLPAFATYDITATETITVTVPASALVLTAVAVVGAPTFTVVTVGQAAILSGSIFGVTEREMRMGGRELIITLIDATWDATIGADNSKTQDLIDGIDSAEAEAAGWDAVVKVGLTFNDIVRTSATIVTITMPPFFTYQITSDENITATIPDSALG